MEVGDTFKTYEAFSEAFELHKQGQNALYRVYASETVHNYLKKHPGRQDLEIPEGIRYMYLKVVCVHYGAPRPRGRGERKNQRYLASNCEASLSVKFCRQSRSLVVLTCHDQHNHLTDAALVQCYSQKRAQVLGEMKPENSPSIREVLKYDPNFKILQRDIAKSGLFVTAKDLYNMRSRLQAKEGSDGEQIIDVLSGLLNNDPGAAASINLGADGQLQMLSFQTSRMASIFEAFPEVLMIDGTYRVNRNRYALYPFLSMDGFGSGRMVFAALLQDEQESSLSRMVKCFKESNPAWDRIKTVVIDKDFAEVKALRAAFPNARILLCTFHVMKAMKLKISTLQLGVDEKNSLLESVKKMIYAKSKQQFDDVMKDICVSSLGFSDYLDTNWMPHKEMWALHLRDCITFGNNTNNRIESFNQKVKQVTHSSETMAMCIEKILALNTAMDQKLMYQLYQNECTSVVIKGQDITTAAFFEIYTEYAARLCCQQWSIAKKAKYGLLEAKDSAPAERYIVKVGSDFQYRVSQDLTACTCTFKKNHDLPCRHVLFIMREKGAQPTESMAAERWLKSYQMPATLGSTGKSDARPLLINKAEYRLASRALSRQQKYVKARHSAMVLASLLSEVGQKEFSERIRVLEDLQNHWAAGAKVAVVLCKDAPQQQEECRDNLLQFELHETPPQDASQNQDASVQPKGAEEESRPDKTPPHDASQNQDASVQPKGAEEESRPDKTPPHDASQNQDASVQPKGAEEESRPDKTPPHDASQNQDASVQPKGAEEQSTPNHASAAAFQEIVVTRDGQTLNLTKTPDLGKKIKITAQRIRGRPKGSGTTFKRKGREAQTTCTKRKRKSQAGQVEMKSKRSKITNDVWKGHSSAQSKIPTKTEDEKNCGENGDMLQQITDAEGEGKDRDPRSDNSTWPPYLPQTSSTTEVTREGLTKQHKKMPLSVCGYKLNLGDLLTLVAPNWLCDQVIDAYLAMLAKKVPGSSFMLPSQLPIKWRKGEMEDWLFEKVRFESFRYIMVPVCYGVNPAEFNLERAHGQHWVLLVADVHSRQVGIFNSMPHTYTTESQQVLQYWHDFMAIRSKKTYESMSAWGERQCSSGTQTDGSSCGVFVLMNAEALVRGVAPDSLTQLHATVYRGHAYQQLMAEHFSNECGARECTAPRRARKLQCDNCHVWLHYKCEHIGQRKPKPFACTRCRERM